MSLPNDTTDYEARARADRALQRIDSHEDLCGERWRQSRAAQDVTNQKIEKLTQKMSEGFGSVYARLWWIAGGALGVSFAVILLLIQELLKR